MARILVVDDRKEAGAVCARLLSRSGHEADAVSTGNDALRKIRQRPPDLVLLDLAMPGMDGFEVLAALREGKIAAPPVVILSSQDDAQARQRAAELGAAGFLVKGTHDLKHLLWSVNRYAASAPKGA